MDGHAYGYDVKGKGRAPLSAISSFSLDGSASRINELATTTNNNNFNPVYTAGGDLLSSSSSSSMYHGALYMSEDDNTTARTTPPSVQEDLFCSQCQTSKPAWTFPLSIATFEPLKVCNKHAWYWTKDRLKSCLPTKRASRQQVIKELLDEDQQGWLTTQVGEGPEGEQGMDEWINRIADRYDWQVQVLTTRKSRGSKPVAPLHQFLLTGRTQSYVVSITHHSAHGVSAVTLDIQDKDDSDRSKRVVRTRRPNKRSRTDGGEDERNSKGRSNSQAPSPALSTLSSLAPTPLSLAGMTPHSVAAPTPHSIGAPTPRDLAPSPNAVASQGQQTRRPPSSAAQGSTPPVSSHAASTAETITLIQNVLEAARIKGARRARLSNQPLPHANPFEGHSMATPSAAAAALSAHSPSASSPSTSNKESPSWSPPRNEPMTLEELLASPYLVPPDVTLPPLSTYHPPKHADMDKHKPTKPSRLRQGATTPIEEELRDEDDEEDEEEGEEDEEEEDEGDWLEGFIMDQLGYEEEEEEEDEWRPPT